jgi:hypothetical protein
VSAFNADQIADEALDEPDSISVGSLDDIIVEESDS